MRRAQATESLPEVNQLAIGTWASDPPATMTKAIQERTTANPEKAAGDVFRAARADPAPENTGDQKTEKRQEDDKLVQSLSPSAN